MSTPDERPLTEHLAAAKQLHAAGQLVEAEQRYRSVLAEVPDHAQAAFGLGVLYWQAGQLDAAWQALDLASRAPAGMWVYLCTRGQLEAAMHRWGDAAATFTEVTRQQPTSHDAWIGLAGAQHRLVQWHDAIAAYRTALALQPQRVETLNDLALALEAMSVCDEAILLYRQALSLRPDFLPAANNLGNALLARGQAEAAASVLRDALERSMGDAELWFNYANALAAQAASDAAVAAYANALDIDPQHAKAHINLGNLLRARGDLLGALTQYQTAIAHDLTLHDAYCNASAVCLGLGQVDDAITLAQSALSYQPDSSVAFNNLGNAFKDAGRLDEAIAAYRAAVEADADNVQAHSNLLYTLSFHPAFDDAAILAEAHRWAAQHLPHPAGGASATTRRPGAIRVGYVSPDFREHCQALFMLPLMANHNRNRFEIYCYAQLARPDHISHRLAAHADVWRLTYGWSDARLAEEIRQDDIDILVDLAMHMSNGRPGVFAMRPAPVQLAWLAYPGTTGNPAIQYRLSDPWLDPPDRPADQYSETTLRLPDTFWCYDPLCNDLTPNALPALTQGYITFGCLNNFCKVSDATLDSWASIMARVPNSRLILLSAPGAHRQRVLELMANRAVDAARIAFVPYQPRRAYLETYHCIDICLDTLPYNGHTTSLDAYWMGVPVVTQVGSTVAGRAGWSQLNNLGLTELAAVDSAGFIDIATGLAADLPRLGELRQSLRSRMLQSPLMDAKRFANGLEAIFSAVHQAALQARSSG